MYRTEEIILKGLIADDEYLKKVYPHIREEYFDDPAERLLVRKVLEYVSKYNNQPSFEALIVNLDNDDSISEELFEEAGEILTSVKEMDKQKDLKWAVDTTEEFCKERALFNAIHQSIKIMDGEEKNHTKYELPEILSEALKVSFDTSIGHDYARDWEKRFEFYHDDQERIPTYLGDLDMILNGGTPRKTLNIILAGTNVGKTLCMCSLASLAMMNGWNVLYITCEMAEERIAERIDANLLNIPLDEMQKIDKSQFENRIQNRVQKKTNGRLIVKEYGTGSAHVGHFRHLLKQLDTREGFKPDIIFVDYLGIMASQRTRLGGSINSYMYVKLIAEELRALAKEANVAVWTGAQTNRGGQSSTDVDLEDTAESFGLPQTADFMMAVMETDELAEMGQFIVKQLKNRYRDKGKNRKLLIGVDKGSQRLYQLDRAVQQEYFCQGDKKGKKKEEDKPVFDSSNTGERLAGEKRRRKKKTTGFSV